MDGSALHLTLRELRGQLFDLRTLAIMAVIGVLLGLAGPFGTFESLPLAGRIAYWVATVFLTYGLGYGFSILADRHWGTGRPVWLRAVLMVVPAGLGATLLMAVLNLAVFGATYLSWEALLVLAAQCFAVSAAVVAIGILMGPRRGIDAGPASPDAPPPILDRVPPQQRGGLVALVVEDHYVDIVTERGKTLVLMRLADAIREATGVPGLQIHRSHWVARAAIVRAHRRDGKVIIELSNGMFLPVSRGYLPTVKDAGLI